MSRKRTFTEEQIIRALREVDAAAKATEVCRRLGVIEQVQYQDIADSCYASPRQNPPVGFMPRPGGHRGRRHRYLADAGANILDSQQHSAHEGAPLFFMRIEFELKDVPRSSHALSEQFAPLAGPLNMTFSFSDASRPKREGFLSRRRELPLGAPATFVRTCARL